MDGFSSGGDSDRRRSVKCRSFSLSQRLIMPIRALTRRHARFVLCCGLPLLAAACGADDTAPSSVPDRLQLTAAQLKSLDSSGQAIVQANPGNANLKSLVDSTLAVLTAGVEARRVDIATNLTSAPLYLVGIHRALARSTGSFSTWTLVAIDDPSRLANLVEVSGFAQSTTGTPPASVSGTIGDGTGIVNATLLQVGAGGAVTEWRANSGTVSFVSDAPGAACPGFIAIPKITCALETMHVHFTANAPSGSGGAGARQATLTTDTDVPTMRLTYTP
jgi:hypothetical protein